jgi:hypothetical protein
LIIRSKSSYFFSGDQIPHNGSTAGIIAGHIPAGPSFADIVYRNPRDIFTMALEAALNGQSVVVQTQDLIALGIEQEGGSGSARVKGKLIGPRSN